MTKTSGPRMRVNVYGTPAPSSAAPYDIPRRPSFDPIVRSLVAGGVAALGTASLVILVVNLSDVGPTTTGKVHERVDIVRFKQKSRPSDCGHRSVPTNSGQETSLNISNTCRFTVSKPIPLMVDPIFPLMVDPIFAPKFTTALDPTPMFRMAPDATIVHRALPKISDPELTQFADASVLIEMTVNPDGEVEGVSVVEAAPHHRFIPAVVEAARKWTYTPSKDGRPFRTRARFRIDLE